MWPEDCCGPLQGLRWDVRCFRWIIAVFMCHLTSEAQRKCTVAALAERSPLHQQAGGLYSDQSSSHSKRKKSSRWFLWCDVCEGPFMCWLLFNNISEIGLRVRLRWNWFPQGTKQLVYPPSQGNLNQLAVNVHSGVVDWIEHFPLNNNFKKSFFFFFYNCKIIF